MKIPLILDCTVRDGGYMNEWYFEDKFVRDVYRATSKAGVDYVELGFHGTTRFFDPNKYGAWRFSAENDIRRVTNGTKGARIGLMVDFGRYDPAEIPPKNESVVELIRIAVHRNRVQEAVKQAEQLKAKGYKVSLQLMGYATYSESERVELKPVLRDAPLDFVYVADSYGSIFPDQIEPLLESLQSAGNLRVGFHAHNQLQLAFANTLEAIRCGADIIDGTIYGIGRASGNLTLETLIAYLQARQPDRFNVLPLLEVIDTYLLKQMQETPWGYQLPYMLSGLFNVHPDYAEDLVKRQEYIIEDIWKALQVIKQQNPVGFSRDILDNLITHGLVSPSPGKASITINNMKVDGYREASKVRSVSYINRHCGRDFLILGGGPSLRTYQEPVREFIKQYNPIVLGANYLGGLIAPDYHAFNNKRRLIDYIEHVNPESQLLLGCNFSETFIRENTSREFEWLMFENQLADFNITDGIVASNCRTISILLAGVAIVMGAQRIFAVGLDGYIGLDTAGQFHFYKESDETSSKEVILERHQLNYRYLQQINEYAEAHGIEGLHILTPTSYAKFYKGINNYIKVEISS